jgi:hypothetical protein
VALLTVNIKRGSLILQVNATCKTAIHNMNSGVQLTVKSKGDYATRQYTDKGKVGHRKLML